MFPAAMAAGRPSIMFRAATVWASPTTLPPLMSASAPAVAATSATLWTSVAVKARWARSTPTAAMARKVRSATPTVTSTAPRWRRLRVLTLLGVVMAPRICDRVCPTLVPLRSIERLPRNRGSTDDLHRIARSVCGRPVSRPVQWAVFPEERPNRGPRGSDDRLVLEVAQREPHGLGPGGERELLGVFGRHQERDGRHLHRLVVALLDALAARQDPDVLQDELAAEILAAAAASSSCRTSGSWR